MTSIDGNEITPRGRLHCVTCGAAADSDTERCSRCGAGFPRFKCSRCGTLLEWGSANCTSCGFTFQDRPVMSKENETGAFRQLEEPLRLILGFQKRLIERLSTDIKMTREILEGTIENEDERSKLEAELAQMEQESVEFLEVQEAVVEMGRVLRDMLDIKESGLRNAIEGLADEVRRRKNVEISLKEKCATVQRLEDELQASVKEKEELRERVHLLQESYAEIVGRQDQDGRAKALLQILEGLLAKLPKRHVDAFAESDDYKLYEEAKADLSVEN